MDNNVRIVPIQQLCKLCGAELPEGNPVQGLAGRICRVCIGLLSEHVLVREMEQHPNIVRIQ
jgi:hypothetical protein